jgi:tRNA pseudouridine55 synthase
MKDGLLIISKPAGLTSCSVDGRVRRGLGVKKLGHVGTLDPFATGLLVLAVNAATKIIRYIEQTDKTYEFEVKFGEKTDTGDLTGRVVENTGYIPGRYEISAVIEKFIGEIQQTPHVFSAVKVNGKRSYELARSGKVPTLHTKTITISDFALKGQLTADTYAFEATVSTGTYIRSLCEDMAKELGTLAHVTALKRTRDGRFSANDAIPLDELMQKTDNIGSVLIPLEDVLDDIPVVLLSCQDAENLAFGRAIATDYDLEKGTLIAKTDYGFLAVVEYDDGELRPKRIVKLK